MNRFIAADRTSAMTAPFAPPITCPIATTSPVRPAISTKTFMLLIENLPVSRMSGMNARDKKASSAHDMSSSLRRLAALMLALCEGLAWQLPRPDRADNARSLDDPAARGPPFRRPRVATSLGGNPSRSLGRRPRCPPPLSRLPLSRSSSFSEASSRAAFGPPPRNPLKLVTTPRRARSSATVSDVWAIHTARARRSSGGVGFRPELGQAAGRLESVGGAGGHYVAPAPVAAAHLRLHVVDDEEPRSRTQPAVRQRYPSRAKTSRSLHSACLQCSVVKVPDTPAECSCSV